MPSKSPRSSTEAPASKETPPLDELISRHEAAAFTQRSTTWLDRATRAGNIPCYRYAGRVLYHRDDLRKLLADSYRPASS